MTNRSNTYRGLLSGIGVKSGREATILLILVTLAVGAALYALLLMSNQPQTSQITSPPLDQDNILDPATPETIKPAISQSKNAYQSGRAAETSGDLPGAYEAYRQAIADKSDLEDGTIDPYIERMRAFARMARATGRLDEADKTLRQTIEIVNNNSGKITGSPSILVANLKGELAHISLKRKDYVAAAEYATEVVKSARPDINPGTAQNEQAIAVTIAALDTLADAQKASKNLPDAIAASEQALSLTKSSVGPMSPSVGLRLERLAVLFEDFGKPLEGLSLRGQALAIAEADSNIDRDDLIINLNNLAEAYRLKGELELAKPLYQKAIKIAESAHGPRAAETAVPLNNLGLLAQWTGNPKEAEDYYMKSLSVIWDAMGPDHDVTQRVLANVVRLLEAQGRDQDISTLKSQYGPPS